MILRNGATVFADFEQLTLQNSFFTLILTAQNLCRTGSCARIRLHKQNFRKEKFNYFMSVHICLLHVQKRNVKILTGTPWYPVKFQVSIKNPEQAWNKALWKTVGFDRLFLEKCECQSTILAVLLQTVNTILKEKHCKTVSKRYVSYITILLK